MNRREVLGAVGLGATGMAGLVGASAGDAGQDAETTTRTTTASGEEDGFTGIDSSADQPFATVWVGSREGVRNPDNNRPHAIHVWNDSDQSRTIGLRLVRGGEGGLAVLDRRFEFPADGYLTVRLLEPADYALAVEPGADGTATTTTASTGDAAGEIEVPRSRFDCNDSWTDVAVTADGQVTATTVTTEIGCPPEVTDRTFTAFGGSCASADEANVAFGAESVTVTGSIRAPDPCHGARLAEVSVPSADVLRLTVATTEPTAGICVRCVGTIEYRADFAFRDRVPGTVEVVHRRSDGTETVTRVTRGGGTTTEAETATRRDAETVTRPEVETTTPEGTD